NSGINFENLIRASWAGMYNSGNLGASCRFTNPNSDWAKNDINFKKSLEKILSLDDATERARSYKMNSREDALLGEIVAHFKSKKQSPEILVNYLLNTSVAGTDQAQPILDDSGRVVVDQTPSTPRPDPAPVVVAPSVRREFNPIRVYTVKATMLNFR